MNKWVTKVLEGRSPASVLDEATYGMLRALSRIPAIAKECPHCGLPIPVYPGRYPTLCPECERPMDKKPQPSIQNEEPQGE